MKAIQVRATGGPEVLELRELPDPVPLAGEALIRVHASGVNFIDVYYREGRYKAPLPLIPGLEGAGHVEAGAKVIATVSTPQKAELARNAGADEVILYTQTGFYEAVMKITNRQGVEVVFDGVGKSTFEQSLKCLRRRGLLALYGAASGPVPLFDLGRLAQMGSLYITRPNNLDYVGTREELTSVAGCVFSMFTSGHLNAPISRVYPLEDASQSHRDLESRKTTGKLLLSTGG